MKIPKRANALSELTHVAGVKREIKHVIKLPSVLVLNLIVWENGAILERFSNA